MTSRPDHVRDDVRDDLRPGDEVDGRFVVEARLGAGGVATVYRVRATDGRSYALKLVVAPQAHVAARFLLEGRVQSALVHPNVVRVHEVLELPGSLALLLDLVPGPTLDELLDAAAPLRPPHADALALPLFRGLHAAHARDVVHRDLKPSNVLLDRDADGRPVPRITDFGLAKLVEAGGSIGQSMTGMFVGTVAYMAPEQGRDGKHVDARADVFALGAMLYRAVVGRDAFRGGGLWDVFEAVQAGAYEPPESVVPGLPARQARAIRAALQPDPAERVPSVAALADLWFDASDALTWVQDPDVSWPEAWLAGPGQGGDTLEAGGASARAPAAPVAVRRRTPRRSPRRVSIPNGLVPALIVAAVLAALVIALSLR